MSSEYAIYQYILNAVPFSDAEIVAGAMNSGVMHMAMGGGKWADRNPYFDLYRSSNQMYYWYVLRGALFRRWIVPNVAAVRVRPDLDKKEKKRKHPVKKSGKAGRRNRRAGRLLLRSDMRCKRFIECHGSIGGLDVWEWEWKAHEATPSYLVGEFSIGFIAQEVQELYPHCVIEDDMGYLMIDEVALSREIALYEGFSILK